MNELTENLYYFEDEDLDIIRSFLVFTLMKNTALDKEDIYSYIYGNGKRILWN